MKLTKERLKQIIREELMKETGGGSGEGIQSWLAGGAAPDHPEKSYADLASRLEQVASMLGSVAKEYVNWLDGLDDKGMGNIVEDALHDVERLTAYAQSATERKEEI